jgi:rhamnogalacturonan endolyase
MSSGNLAGGLLHSGDFRNLETEPIVEANAALVPDFATMRPSTCFLFACVVSSAAALCDGVVIHQSNDTFQLSNGRLDAVVRRTDGVITRVRLDGRELLGGGSGYWSMSASSGNSRVGGFGKSKGQAITIDPTSNGGARGEVGLRFKGTGGDGAYPGTAEVRYALAADSTTLHATAILEHGAGDADFRVGEARFVIKLDPELFDFLAIDKHRRRIMPTPEDWIKGEPDTLKEVRRLVTGIHAGTREHKYAYSAILGDVPAYGWAGTRSGFGVWMINPSVEYIAGGPTKMELTGHLDVGGAAMPTLLNMWHGSHYGGTSLSLARDEPWAKVIGPFAIHFNHGGTPAELWQEAVQTARRERAAWPYDWVRHPRYDVPSSRGSLTGTIRIKDPLDPALKHGRVRVGLTAPDRPDPDARDTLPVTDWQRDGKYYQYWTTAGPDGAFKITGVRPGKYVLRAFADGVPGEFQRADIHIQAADLADVGAVDWIPARYGPTLWQIGVADRSAAEFRNGDRYWLWGNHLKFREDFPKGIDYHVGTSRWERDWHLCQPLDIEPGGKVIGPSTWKVRFDIDRIPEHGAMLRIGICGSRARSSLVLRLNGGQIGTTGSLPENGVMHRDSHRGFWFERSFEIPAENFRSGENVMEFRLHGNAWHQGLLYDYIRMETLQPHEKN